MDQHSLNIVLMGPPGAGKGTQAVLLSQALGIPRISTGDIFRDEISQNSEMGTRVQYFIENGLLVPDETTIEVVKQRLKKTDCAHGFILDGFPRTLQQAESMGNNGIIIARVILLEVDEDVILERLAGRRTCPECHRMYHLRLNPPKVADQCDDCAVTLIQRKDDEPATIRHRMEVYREQTEPLIAFYSIRSDLKFTKIEANLKSKKAPEDISKAIQEWLITQK